MLLEGKNIIVTGAIQGIGRTTVSYLASSGANVWACAMNRTEEFEDFCFEEAKKNNVQVTPIYFNLLDCDQIKAAVKVIQQEKRPIHGLINVAGIANDGLFNMISMDAMKKVFDINFFSQIYFTQYVVKLMQKTQAGSIVFISSISALDGNIGQLSYASSKAALIGAMRTMSKELAPKGIRVNCIAPGVIDTDMNKIVPHEVIQQKINHMDIKRLGTPDEVAGVLAFLMSDLSTYITGQVIRIDGGIRF